MEKRIFGIILTLLGIAGLGLGAFHFVQGTPGTGNSQHVKAIVVYLVLGIVFFFAGIGLLKGTKDLTPKG